METLKIAISDSVMQCINTQRNLVALENSDLTDVAAVVLSVQDALGGALDKVEQSAFGLPVFVAEACDQRLPAEYLPRLTGVFACGDGNQDF
ncbi:ornithine decarboxylase, partial [Edwardsiella piscicida]|nr:ornithine decarboxylase [Edwardsiella piscicida]